MVRSARMLLIVASLIVTLGCARDLRREPTEMTALDASEIRVIRVAEAVTVSLDSGYSRSIAAGSQWRSVGQISMGTVFKPVGQVFSIEGAHVHEAYLVLQGNNLVAFYLPGERKVNALGTPVVIKAN